MSLLVAVKSVTPTIDPLNNTKTLIHVDRTAVNAIAESKNIMGEALSSSLLEGTSILKVTLDFDASPTNNGVFIVPSRNNYFGRGFALSPIPTPKPVVNCSVDNPTGIDFLSSCAKKYCKQDNPTYITTVATFEQCEVCMDQWASLHLNSVWKQGGNKRNQCSMEEVRDVWIILEVLHMEIIGYKNSNGNLPTISGNETTRLFFVGPGATLLLTDLQLSFGCVVSSNSFSTSSSSTCDDNGGSIYVDHGTLIGTRLLFNRNSAGEKNGGAIYSVGTSIITLSESTFYKNIGTEGGALHFSDGVTFSIDDSEFISNTKEGRLPTCKPPSSLTEDPGYSDSYRGWYDVQRCGKCNDYCRWVGGDGSGGDPSIKTRHLSSWWSCRLAGGTNERPLETPWNKLNKCDGKSAKIRGGAVFVSGPTTKGRFENVKFVGNRAQQGSDVYASADIVQGSIHMIDARINMTDSMQLTNEQKGDDAVIPNGFVSEMGNAFATCASTFDLCITNHRCAERPTTELNDGVGKLFINVALERPVKSSTLGKVKQIIVCFVGCCFWYYYDRFTCAFISLISFYFD